jgi:hypothetical protein
MRIPEMRVMERLGPGTGGRHNALEPSLGGSCLVEAKNPPAAQPSWAECGWHA